ncbi:MAG: sugar phosphate nucleotidyltransferase [Acidimicrobiia bacterium]|nr:sugar phosphate nucleotidyltransferase [Acidimicrobiia bacterium]MDH5503038.1 sugar phosphate nucleotidyltransferase [Acidimicrobiia bacterium]
MSVDVVVIPAAGRGTRMRPATRSVPKALVTVIDRPTIQYAVEEAARAGVTEAVLVVNLDAAADIERHFLAEGPLPGLENMRVRMVVQEEPHGLGHAVLTAQEAVGNRRFFCGLGDMIAPPSSSFYERLESGSGGGSAVALQEGDGDFYDRYGIVGIAERLGDGLVQMSGAIEKPGQGRAPSNLWLVGRYLFGPDVFDHLASIEPGHGGEVQLTDAIDAVAKGGQCRGVVIPDDLLDVGNPLDLLKASTALGLQSDEFGVEYRDFLAGLR